MKKMMMVLMFVLGGYMTMACVEDGPLPADDDSPDAGQPDDQPDAAMPDDPDACPPDQPDAAPTADANAPDASSPDADCEVCDGNEDCSDGRTWTGDACSESTGLCVHWPIDCGGMEVKVPSNWANTTCKYWDGFGVPPDEAQLIDVDTPSNSWEDAPTHACSAKCYDNATGQPVRMDCAMEWNGFDFQHQEFTNVLKCTWDGLNMEY